nr:aminoglycoside phosphotransferase family protein [Knoellia sp. DB2414S]
MPRRPEVEPRAILARLDPGLADAPLAEVGEGFDNVAYAVDGRLLLRVSKKTDPDRRRADAERDAALLQLIAAHMTLPTNEVVAADLDDGALLMTLVGGATADQLPPLDPGAFAATMARFLTELHALPADDARHVALPDRSQQAWLDETVELWRQAESRFEPSDRAAVEKFLAEPAPAPPARMVFCHNDLGDEHIILSDDGRDVSGVIDWSDAVLGDPARDLALLAFDFGPDMLDRVLRTYLPAEPDDPALRDRALWFARRAGVEGVAWRALNRPHTAPVALDRLRAVLA